MDSQRQLAGPGSDFRSDIEGLRGIAVLAVLAFHMPLGPLTLPGGFFGVDVFFVISGFLITGLLTREWEDHRRIDFKAFYGRRLRRLGPALVAVLLVTLAVSCLILLPQDLVELSESTGYALLALSNLYFYNDTGYFDQAAELRPLLHTWSLAIEEQFYLLWPLLLSLWFRIVGRRGIALGIAACTLVGFSYCVVLVEDQQKLAFYSPLARCWELTLGALCVFLPRLPTAGLRAARYLAAALLTTAFVFPAADHQLPGLGTLPAVLGAALLVWPQRVDTASIRSLLLDFGPLRWVGRVSYSLYLWHWPLWVLALHYRNGANASVLEAAGLWCASLLFATASHRLIEERYRRPGQFPAAAATAAGAVPSSPSTRRLTKALGSMSAALQQQGAALGASVALAVALVAIPATDGALGRRFPTHVVNLDRAALWSWTPARPEATPLPLGTGFGAPWEAAQRRVFLWGDSHAGHVAPLLEAALESAAAATHVTLLSGCSPIIDGDQLQAVHRDARYNRRCAREHRQAKEFLDRYGEAIDEVVLAAAWASRLRLRDDIADAEGHRQRQWTALSELERELNDRGFAVTLLGQVPSWRLNPLPCAAAQQAALWRAHCSLELTLERLGRGYLDTAARLRQQILPTTRLVEPHRALCTDGTCDSTMGQTFLYRDDNHLRRDLDYPQRAALAQRLGLEAIVQTNSLDAPARRAQGNVDDLPINDAG
ncbi:MAG: acyltransferase family protein [Pseudomonadota bacterium]